MTRANRLGPLDPIYDVDTAYGGISIGNSPSTALVTVTINKAIAQPDPTSTTPILFDVVFSEPVTGFATGDVTLTSSTAGGSLVGTVIGSSDIYTVSVAGMTTTGNVTASIASGVCTAIATGVPNRPSTSVDNTVAWVSPVPPPSTIYWWDFSYAPSRSDTGSTINSVTDRISSLVMTNIANATAVTDLGGQGLTACQLSSYGGPFNRMTANPPIGQAQPIWVSFVGKLTKKPGGSEGFKANWFSATNVGGDAPSFRSGSLVSDGNNNILAYAGSSLVDGAAADENLHIFYVEYNGASSKIYIDGSLVASGAAGSSGWGTVFTLFNLLGGGVESNETIGEIAFGTGTNPNATVLGEYMRLTLKWV